MTEEEYVRLINVGICNFISPVKVKKNEYIYITPILGPFKCSPQSFLERAKDKINYPLGIVVIITELKYAVHVTHEGEYNISINSAIFHLRTTRFSYGIAIYNNSGNVYTPVRIRVYKCRIGLIYVYIFFTSINLYNQLESG